MTYQSTYLHFETQRLILRPVVPEDAAFYFQLMNSPKWLQNIGDRQLSTVQDSEQYIQQKMIPALKKHGFSSYTVIRRTDQAMLGTCGLFDRAGLNGIDLGFALLPEYEGKGYAYEAASRILRAAFEDFHLPEMLAIASPQNTASLRLLKKLGFQSVGHTTLPAEMDELILLKAFS
jgi:RimJ/RimL family protein N-acetyltransferase